MYSLSTWKTFESPCYVCLECGGREDMTNYKLWSKDNNRNTFGEQSWFLSLSLSFSLSLPLWLQHGERCTYHWLDHSSLERMPQVLHVCEPPLVLDANTSFDVLHSILNESSQLSRNNERLWSTATVKIAKVWFLCVIVFWNNCFQLDTRASWNWECYAHSYRLPLENRAWCTDIFPQLQNSFSVFKIVIPLGNNLVFDCVMIDKSNCCFLFRTEVVN